MRALLACALCAGALGCFTDRGFIGEVSALECGDAGECEHEAPPTDAMAEPDAAPECDAGDDDDDECSTCSGPADCSDAMPLCIEGECRQCASNAHCPEEFECDDGQCKAEDEEEDNSGSDEGENEEDNSGEG